MYSLIEFNIFLRLRREKIFAASDVQKQLDKLNDEHEVVKRKLEAATKVNKQYEAQVAKYIDKLRDAEEYNCGLESHYQKEIANQTKLAELYQKANDEAEAKNKNLLNAVAELQKMVSDAENLKAEVETKYLKTCAKFDQFKEESSSEMEKMQIELERANELIEVSRKNKELVEMSPSAEAISKQMKSGMKFTEIYSNYVDATAELDNQKAENQRLQKSLDQIIQEVQEKAPILKQQKQDYEKSLITNCDLTKKLDLAMVQSQKAKSTIESLQRGNDHLKRQNASLEQTKDDFCKQLQHMIRENTMLKGGHVVDDRNQPGNPESIMDETFSNDSDKIISLNLVKYSDIVDLQVKNTQLLAALRSISDEKEAEQEGKYRTKLENLEMKLKNSVDENDLYQDEMRKMKDLLSKSERQNNMYKVLLEQREESASSIGRDTDQSEVESNVIGSRESASALTPTKIQQIQQATVAAAMSEEERKTLQGVIQELKEEVKQWKEETRNAEVQANERCFEYQKENSDLRLQNSKLVTASSSLNDKVKMQELNESVLQKELESHRSKVNAMSSTQAKMQANIDVLNTDIRAAQEKYSSAYVQLQSLQSERSVWKNTEKHLVRERDRLLEEKRVQSNLMANIDSLKNALEFNANDQQIRYQKAIGTLQANLDISQKKNRELETEKRNCVKDYETRLKDLGEKMNAEMEKNKQTTVELTKVKNDLATSENQLQLKISQLEQSGIAVSKHNLSGQESMDANVSRSSQEEDLANVSMNLEKVESELEVVKTQKKTLEQHLENYKHMCAVSEEKYDADTAQQKEKIENLEKQIKELSNSQKAHFQTIANLENENTKLREDLKVMVDNSDSSHSKIVRKCDDLESQLSNALVLNNGLKNEIENLKMQLDDKTENLSVLSGQLETSTKKLSEGTSQFANLESQLLEKSKEADRFKAQIESMGIEIEGFKSQIEFNLNSYKSKEAHFTSRVKDLEQQNQILLEEIDKLGALVSKTKTSILDVSLSDSISGEIPENPPPGTENLLELIRHLRREKDIYLAKYEVNQGECERSRQKLEFTQKRVSELESMLKEEEERHQKMYQALSQQEELDKKNDQVLVLQDSNSFLRKEAARLQDELTAEKASQKQAEEAALKPLKDEIATLTLNAEAHLSEVQIMTDEITKWKARNNELLERITKIDSDENKKVLAKAKELESKNVSLTAELKGLESRLFLMNKEKNEFVEKYKASSTEANLLRTAKNSLETEKTSLVKQVETMKGQVNNLESKVTGSKGSADELNNLKTRYNKLQVYAKGKVENEKVIFASFVPTLREIRV